MSQDTETVDVLVIGGGINGAGIARDAAGRGLSVLLCEQGDLASGTSSASTKLFHGGLRYLENFAFSLVRKALIEREVLLRNMPHIAQPMRFVLPHHRGLRPAWMLRLGLLLYDSIGGRRLLPGTKTIALRRDPAGAPLKPEFKTAFEYSDCWVDDARLVVLNARDAADRGAGVMTRMQVSHLKRDQGLWSATLIDTVTADKIIVTSRAVVNAAGPWVNGVLENVVGQSSDHPLRLVRGSHVVTRKLFDHDRAYFNQLDDGRIFFAIPYEEDFTLIGTTDVDHEQGPDQVLCSEEEKSYLCAAASSYFANPVTEADIVWSYAGVRPLDDTSGGDASDASRDYDIELDDDNGALPFLSIFGGKITTYRVLAEQALARLKPYFPTMPPDWTHDAPLPGGDIALEACPAIAEMLIKDNTWMDARTARRWASAYGSLANCVAKGERMASTPGIDFGAGLFEVEVRWLMALEWAQTAEDVVWRRTKCGLRMTFEEIDALQNWMQENRE